MTLAAVTGGEQQDQKASMRRKERRLLYSTFRWEYIKSPKTRVWMEYGTTARNSYKRVEVGQKMR